MEVIFKLLLLLYDFIGVFYITAQVNITLINNKISNCFASYGGIINLTIIVIRGNFGGLVLQFNIYK